MKVIDIIFALVAGRIAGFLLGDFLREWDIHINLYWTLAIWIALPFIALAGLWLAHIIGRKFLFVFQAVKHLLVGGVATIFDLKLFELLVWIFSLVISLNPLIAKGISFLASTGVKYWGNKYWAFEKHEKENWHKEAFYFFCITLVGLFLDVAAFHYCTEVLGPQLGASSTVWLKLSVIFAALAAAAWNFLGYKLLVFRK